MNKIASIVFSVVSVALSTQAQIPITTVNTPSGTPPTAPQPQLIPCTPALDPLNNTSWAFSASGGSIAEIGRFSVTRTGRGLTVNGSETVNTLGTTLGRLIAFGGAMDYLCLAGTNTAAAGTLQIADGLGGQIFTWSFPITATINADRSITYTVTSVSTLNLRPVGAVDPAGPPPGTNATNGYSYASSIYATTGTATLITGQIPCPVPANSVLDTLSPNGFTVTYSVAGSLPGTLKFTAGSGPVGTVTGNLFGTSPSNPQPTETGNYMVYSDCSGFTLSFPYIRNGVIVGANFEGVFQAGNFSRFLILPTNVDGVHFTGVRN